jgi:hypothetical protein
MRQIGPGWTPERVEVLKVMQGQGASGSTIASALGTTRNAVIGKSHRLGLYIVRAANDQRRSNGRVNIKRGKRKSGGKTMKSGDVTDYETQPNCDPVGIVALEPWHCRWPVEGEGAEMMYCGAPKTVISYCAYHWRKAHVPAMRARPVPLTIR